MTLVATLREVIPVYQFFLKLTSIIYTVNASCKRNDKLQAAQAIKVAKMIAIDKLKAGKGANQIGTLQRAVILDGVLISVRFFKMLYVKDIILFNVRRLMLILCTYFFRVYFHFTFDERNYGNNWYSLSNVAVKNTRCLQCYAFSQKH